MNKNKRGNLTLKILSVLFALILWLFALEQDDIEISYKYEDIPVVTQNMDMLNQRGLTLVENLADTIDIQVRGYAKQLRKFDKEQLAAYIDLSKINDWKDNRVEADIKGLPSGITLKKRAEISIYLDELYSRTVPVGVQKDTDSIPGYVVKPVKMIPNDYVTVSGPSSIVKQIHSAYVSIDIAEYKTTSRVSKEVKLVDKAGNILSNSQLKLDPKYIMVTVPVFLESQLPVEVKYTGIPQSGYEVKGVEVYPNTVSVYGDDEIISSLEYITTDLIDIHGIASDVTQNVKLMPPEGISITDEYSGYVDITIKIGEVEEEKVIAIDNIDFKNIPQGYKATLMDKGIKLTIVGPVSAIKDLDESNIMVYADLKEVSRGENSVDLNVELPEGLKLVSSLDKVTVTCE